MKMLCSNTCNLTFSCVMDRDPRFVKQIQIWVLSLLYFGKINPNKIVIHSTFNIDKSLQEWFDFFEVKVKKVGIFNQRTRHCNKLLQLESDLLLDSDYICLMDCDTAVLNLFEFSKHILVGGKITHMQNPPTAILNRIFHEAGVGVYVPYPVSFQDNRNNICYTDECNLNGGVYIFESNIFKVLRKLWPKWANWGLYNHTLFGAYFKYIDQISLCLALKELNIPVIHFPIEMNCPTFNIRKNDPRDGVIPIILHYHSLMDNYGFLKLSNISYVDSAINHINSILQRYVHT